MCIFCEIIKGNIPSSCIYEDEHVLAFLDIAQVCVGHTLVVPKKHVENIFACDQETLDHVMHVAHRLGSHIMKRTGALGMNVLSNVNEVAGQSVPHFHVHLIPRYGDDDACVIHFNESAPQDLDALQKKLSFRSTIE